MVLLPVSSKKIWMEFAKDIGAEYVDKILFRGSYIKYKYKTHIMYLDIKELFYGSYSTICTRMRVPFENDDKMYFDIRRKGVKVLADLIKRKDLEIETGHEDFDNDFIIKGNNESKIKNIIDDKEIRKLIELQPRIVLNVEEGDKLFDDVLEEKQSVLVFKANGIMKDKDNLKNLFKLFEKIVDKI